MINIADRLHSTATEQTVAGANEIYDDAKGKKQDVINQENDEHFSDIENESVRVVPQEFTQTEQQQARTNLNTYSKEEVNHIASAFTEQNYVTVQAVAATTAADIPTLINATGDGEQTDTIYRVGWFDGTAFDATKYSLYTWNGTAYIQMAVRSSIGEVFDISVYNTTGGTPAQYETLALALGTNGANVPSGVRQGGMSVKYIQSSDNNYVQYRLMSDTFNTTVANWQGVDEVPTAGSDNLVKSGGVEKSINLIGSTVQLYQNVYKGFLYNNYTGVWSENASYAGVKKFYAEFNHKYKFSLPVRYIIHFDENGDYLRSKSFNTPITEYLLNYNDVVYIGLDILIESATSPIVKIEDITDTTIAEMQDEIDELQGVVTDVDNVPTENSTKFVKSGGVYNAEAELDERISLFQKVYADKYWNKDTGVWMSGSGTYLSTRKFRVRYGHTYKMNCTWRYVLHFGANGAFIRSKQNTDTTLKEYTVYYDDVAFIAFDFEVSVVGSLSCLICEDITPITEAIDKVQENIQQYQPIYTGYLWNINNHNWTTGNGYSATKKIRVTPNNTYKLDQPPRYIFFFDANGDYVSHSSYTDNTYIVTIGSGIHFIGIDFETSDINADTLTILNIDNVSKLYGKTLYNDGDSVAHGASGEVAYAEQIATLMGMTLTNAAVSGTTIGYKDSDPNYTQSIPERMIANLTNNDYDYILFEGGFNDIAHCQIGEITEGFQPATIDPMTTIGGLEKVCQWLWLNKPTAKKLFVLGQKYNYNAQKPFWEAIISVLEKWGIPYVDIWRETQLIGYNSTNKARWYHDADGLHPNTAAYANFFNDLIISKLESL